MRRILILLVAFGVAAVAVSGYYLQELESELSAPLNLAEGETIRVERGASLKRIATEFESRGWVTYGEFLRWYVHWKRPQQHLKAGEYAVEPGMAAMDLVDRMIAGDVILHQITFIEGTTFAEARQRLAASPHVIQTLNGLSDEAVLAQLSAEPSHPEGSILADTYLFESGTTDLVILTRAHRAMREQLAAVWEERDADLPLDSPYALAILASIVEKESASAQERRRIAGVFISRLRKGMRLETDPTVIYGLGEAFDGNLTRKHLRTDTPYNTYTRHGLPPSPIALVGRDALAASARPEIDGSLFFVSRGDGTHKFSVTYKEHRRAVYEYQIKPHRRAGKKP